MRVGIAAIICFFVLFYLPGVVYGQSDNSFRIIIVENGQTEFGIRLASEIRAQGMTAEVIEQTESADHLPTPTGLIKEYDAAALMEISADGSRIFILLKDSPVRPEILINNMEDEDTKSLFVFKSVEMVRAMLLSAPSDTTANRKSAPEKVTEMKKIAPTRSPQKRYRRLGGTLLSGVLNGSGNIPPGLSISGGIVVSLTENFRIHTEGVFPITRMELQKPEGKLSARAFFIGAFLESVWPMQRLVEMHAGIGMAALILSTKGNAVAPYISESALLTTAMPELNVGVSIGSSQRIRFRLDMIGGWTVHELKLETALGSKTDFGPLVVGFRGGFEIWLF